MPDRRKRPLLAVAALAESARYPDRRRRLGALEVDAVRVHHLARMLDAATEADRLHRLLRVVAARVLVDRPREAEVSRAVGESRDLDADHAGRHEGREHVPARAGAREAREADPAR